MKKTLVTGATGLVGYALVQALLREGRYVCALVRSKERAKLLLPANVELVQGDVTDITTVNSAIQGCECVFHAAGIPEQWLPKSDLFARVNVGGTKNMIEAARAHEVKRFVYISTVDVFAARSGEKFDETRIDTLPKGTPYERSKQDADSAVVKAVKDGLPAVFIHPAAVYGPGPASSPGLNKLIVDIHSNKVPMVPPGVIPVIYSEDLAKGCLSAENRAVAGERFIFCESTPEFGFLARVIAEQLDISKAPRVMPLWLAKAVALVGESISSVTGNPPLIHRGQLHLLQWRAVPVSDKAKRLLDWEPLTLRAGIQKTINHLI